jgi:antitoxin component HigA of HigAB toxin-antitoxin module
VNVASKRGLPKLTAKCPDAEVEALDWYRFASFADWSCFGDVRRAGPEETALHSLLATLVKEYDDRAYPLPPGDPVRMLQFLMDQRGLRAADLTPIFGARSIASLVLNRKRELSKAHIRKLAEFFHVSAAVFLG